jgi:hypothetical protein
MQYVQKKWRKERLQYEILMMLYVTKQVIEWTFYRYNRKYLLFVIVMWFQGEYGEKGIAFFIKLAEQEIIKIIFFLK